MDFNQFPNGVDPVAAVFYQQQQAANIAMMHYAYQQPVNWGYQAPGVIDALCLPAPGNWGQGEAAEQDCQEINFQSWKNYDMGRFKKMFNTTEPKTGIVRPGSEPSNVFHVYHSWEGERSCAAALSGHYDGQSIDSCFGGFFRIDINAADNANQDNPNRWFGDMPIFPCRRSLILADMSSTARKDHPVQKPFLHHFASMSEAVDKRDFVLEKDYISIEEQPSGTPLLFKSFGTFDANNQPALLDMYRGGCVKKMGYKYKMSHQPGKSTPNPRPFCLHWDDMVWDRLSSMTTDKSNDDWGILIMKGPQEAIDEAKKKRRSSQYYYSEDGTKTKTPLPGYGKRFDMPPPGPSEWKPRTPPPGPSEWPSENFNSEKLLPPPGLEQLGFTESSSASCQAVNSFQ